MYCPDKSKRGWGKEGAQNECTAMIEHISSPTLSLSYFNPRMHKALKIAYFLSVPIAQLVKAWQRFCFPEGLEFKSRPSLKSFNDLDLHGGIL
jgi:hypothetical protein